MCGMSTAGARSQAATAHPAHHRRSGIAAIGDLPWGSHFCVLYATAQELLDAIVPFIGAGLQAGEFCSWELAPALTEAQARQALGAALPGFERYETAGQLAFAAPAADDGPPTDEMLEEQLDRALLAGFGGLRLVRSDTRSGANGPAARAEGPGSLVLIAWTCPRAHLGAMELMERVQQHPFALVCNAGAWQLLKGSEARGVLGRSEEKLQSLFTNMSEAFAYQRIVRDAAGQPCDCVFLDVNPAFARLTGLDAREVLGKRLSQVFPGFDADRAGWVADCAHVAQHGQPMQLERYVPHLQRWYSLSLFSDRLGYVAMTFSDISDRRHAERALRESEARFKLLSDSAGLLLSSENPQAAVSRLCGAVMEHLECDVFFNFLAEPATGRLLLNACAGIAEDEARRIESLDFGDGVAGWVAQYRVPALCEDIQHTSDYRTEAGRAAGIQAYCCHPLLAEGRLLGTLSFGTRARPSFTLEEVALMKTVAAQVAVAIQRIQAQHALQELNLRLQEADRRKDEFLALLSHELRNPLAPIHNCLYILDHAPADSEQARRSLEVIRRQTAHLSRLVDDLLDVTRIARGKVRLQRESVDLVEVVRRAVDDYRSSFASREVNLRVKLSDRALWAHADPTRVTQVVGNLLGNAVKFTPAGRAVDVELAEREGAAVLRVRDDGVGIAPEMIGRLFEPFSQAEQPISRPHGGLGLGLALVKGLAELHGGSVAAASAGLGRGAEFTFMLPLQRGAAAHRSATSDSVIS